MTMVSLSESGWRQAGLYSSCGFSQSQSSLLGCKPVDSCLPYWGQGGGLSYCLFSLYSWLEVKPWVSSELGEWLRQIWPVQRVSVSLVKDCPFWWLEGNTVSTAWLVGRQVWQNSPGYTDVNPALQPALVSSGEAPLIGFLRALLHRNECSDFWWLWSGPSLGSPCHHKSVHPH